MKRTFSVELELARKEERAPFLPDLFFGERVDDVAVYQVVRRQQVDVVDSARDFETGGAFESVSEDRSRETLDAKGVSAERDDFRCVIVEVVLMRARRALLRVEQLAHERVQSCLLFFGDAILVEKFVYL